MGNLIPQEHGKTTLKRETTLSSKRVYKGRLIRLRVDQVRLPDGRITTREIVGHRGSVAIVALDAHRRVVLVRQYRKAVETTLLELPAGTLEPGENPEDCAFRELQEETGYHADALKPLAAFYTAPGYCSEHLYLYLATDLHRGAAQVAEDESIEVVLLPLEEAVRLVRQGEICDAKSMVGLLLVAGIELPAASDQPKENH